MSSSGLIYAAIAVLWAAVLIPMWLRGHDSTVENRSADRFGQAMRVLSRRNGADDLADDGERPLEAEAAATAEDVPDGTVAPAHSGQRPARPVSRPVPRPAQVSKARPSLARRRARTLSVLFGVTVLLTVVALLSPLTVWVAVPPALLLVAFVVHLRNQAKRNEELRRRRRTSGAQPTTGTRPEESEATATDAAVPDAPHERVKGAKPKRAVPRPEFVPGPSRAVVVETKRVGRAEAADPGQTAELPRLGAEQLADDEAWRPNSLPLPTYVTAPKAIRPIRVIDLTTPGAWTSGRLIDDEGLATEDALAAELAADELDAMLEHESKGSAPSADDASRRAVGD
ncbi:MAG TPA: hypothetical protein VMT27_06205 [Actinomycetes bacterium]|nr:hypothetical protein [Actinomycetes bacterium]